MPRPERSFTQNTLGQNTQYAIRDSQQLRNQPQVGGISSDIRALNSSILLITQKMKYFVRNEKILGRNLIILNKKLKELDEKVGSPIQGSSVSAPELQELSQRIASLEEELRVLKQEMVTEDSLKELRYIIDTINPLDFATLEQVRAMIDEALVRKKAQV
jgi:uncharacterized coiled-coil DUF342 family protein